MKKPKNPIFFALISIFIVLNIADAITAIYIQAGETNPLFLLIGSLWPLYVFKVLLIGILIIVYRQSLNTSMSEFTYYIYMLVLTMSMLIIGLGVYSNVQGILNPELVEYAATIPAAEKVQIYVKTVGFIYMLPTVLSLMAFKFYQWSRKHILLKNGTKNSPNKGKEVQMGDN